MDKAIVAHELEMQNYLNSTDSATNWSELIAYHKRQIDYFQAERLIHLMVTMIFALVSVLTVFFVIVTKNIPITIVSVLLLLLLIPYIFHYFQLENGVQRLYKIDQQLQKKRFENLK